METAHCPAALYGATQYRLSGRSVVRSNAQIGKSSCGQEGNPALPGPPLNVEDGNAMRIILIDTAEFNWLVLVDDAGAMHRYARREAASPLSRPHGRILSHGLVRLTVASGLPVLDSGCLPATILVDRQGGYSRFEETLL
jgi:hypothetical protein